MNKFFKSMMAVVALASIMTFSSCTKECDPGYEGDKCEDKWITNLLGTWTTNNEVCTSGGPSTFQITITEGSEVTKINISGLYGAAGVSASGTVDEGDNVTIASQPFGTGSISGSGTLSGSTLTLNYSVTGGGSTDACNGVTFTKL